MSRGLAVTVALSLAFVAEARTLRIYDRDVEMREVNYDRTKIPAYELEDPLEFVDGRAVRTAADWAERRKEILGIFAREMYGQPPPEPDAVVTELRDEKVTVAGYAIRRQYRMWFRKDRKGPCVSWIVWIPRFAPKPVPVILFLNFGGNHELVSDPDIPVQQGWMRTAKDDATCRSSERTRGVQQDAESATVFPIGTIIARGYAVMSACYCEVSPDPDRVAKAPEYSQYPFAFTGVFDLWGRRDPKRTDNVTSLGAWAWALSRGLDLAERIGEIDAKRSVVTGCSRLGKAALLAGARDERFAVCVPVQTGGGGCPLAKREFGENVSSENIAFPHWFCAAYGKHSAEPWRTLTFDQHLLLASIAPRALLVEGYDAPWFDTEGEYLAVRAASPVWKLLGKNPMPDVPWPAPYDRSAIGGDLGYVHRSQAHGISAYDWNWMMDFADRVFGK